MIVGSKSLPILATLSLRAVKATTLPVRRSRCWAPSAPNLIVQPRNVGFNPAAPTEGDRVLIRAIVLNDGAEDAADVVVQILDVTEAGAVPIGRPHVITFLAAGSSATVPIVYDTLDRPGVRRIRVVVDPSNFILRKQQRGQPGGGFFAGASGNGAEPGDAVRQHQV